MSTVIGRPGDDTPEDREGSEEREGSENRENHAESETVAEESATDAELATEPEEVASSEDAEPAEGTDQVEDAEPAEDTEQVEDTEPAEDTDHAEQEAASAETVTGATGAHEAPVAPAPDKKRGEGTRERREATAPELTPEERAERARARRRTMGSVGLALLVLAGIAAAVPFTPMMPVNGVNVDGNTNLPAEQIEEMTGVEPGTPMGRVDVRGAAEGVAANPWVKSVTAKRDWPGSIDVQVQEYVPVAFVAMEDGTHLIDAEGKDFMIADPPKGAMELVGPGIADEEGKRQAVEIAASISDQARGQVEALEARGPYDYVLRLVEGRTVVWGAAEDNANKALALESVLQMEGTEFNIVNPELVTSR